MANTRAWSLSALNNFETCPRKYHETAVLKRFKEPEGEALVWGNRVHKAFEDYYRNGKPFPKGMERYKQIADRFLGAIDWDVVEAERKFAMNRNLDETAYFARDVWVRGLADVLLIKGDTALVLDWKTGKRKFDDDQLALLAAMVFRGYPSVTKVRAAFVWLADGDAVDQHFYSRDEQQALWSRFTGRVKKFDEAFKADDFPPNPSGLCRRHCPVKTCEYHGGV